MWRVGERGGPGRDSNGESREGGVQRTRGPTSSRALFVQFFLAASWSSIACWMYIFPTKISFSSTDSSFKEMGQFRRSRASFKTALFSKYCRGLIASNLRNTERRQQKWKDKVEDKKNVLSFPKMLLRLICWRGRQKTVPAVPPGPPLQPSKVPLFKISHN